MKSLFKGSKKDKAQSAQKMQKDIAYSFEDEVFFSLQSQRNRWAMVAVLSLCLSAVCIGSIVALLPLKEIKPYVVMVDKTTGEAEKIVQVRPVELSEQEAVLQAELVSYVVDRETYDIADNADRIPEVLDRSDGNAVSSLRSLWRSSSPNYPPSVYGDNSRVLVKIKSISILPDSPVARIHFQKTREFNNGDSVSRQFVATVGFKFRPQVEKNLEVVWKNPLGFVVTSYRVDAETINQLEG